MAVLTVSGLSKSYGIDTIFKDVSFIANEKEVIGLIGQNGAGKTTLFKIISGLIPYDSGDIITPKDISIGCYDQLPTFGDKTVYDYCLESYSHVFKLMERQEELQHTISDYGERSQLPPQNVMDEYSQILDKLQSMNAYAYDSEIKGTLKGLGFSDNDFIKKCSTLSGGEMSRLNLCRLLLEKHDVFLLDEPTNHLDISSVAWLESFIRKSDSTFIIISHDRFFLDQVVDKIIELENGRAIWNPGTYTQFVKYKESLYETLMKEYEKAAAEIERQEDIVRRMRQHQTEKLAKRASSREKALEKMTLPEKPFRMSDSVSLMLHAAKLPGFDVLSVESLSKSYGPQRLFDSISFNVYKDEKIGIIGPNGAGKSTLLKAMLGRVEADGGSVRFGQGVDVGYYDQNLESFDENNDLIEEISHLFPSFDTTRIRTLLGAFLFKGDDVFKRMRSLSGGERARIALLKLMLRGNNVLFLDEPTNHLDIYSREVMEDALLKYNGTIIAVSHDRYFLNKICSRTLVLEDGHITDFLGNYDYCQEKIRERMELENRPAVDISMTKTQMKDDRRKQKELQQESKRLKKQISDIEADIALYEEKIRDVEELLCDEAIYTDFEKVRSLNADIESYKAMVLDLYSKWEELSF